MPRGDTYDKAIAQAICDRIAEGETLRDVCTSSRYFPNVATVYRWRLSHPEFADMMRIAREQWAETQADECIRIADDDTGDLLEDGKANTANVQRSRLQIETRRYLMGRLNPQYREKIQHDVSGKVEHKHSVTLSETERARRLASILLEHQQGQTIEGEAVRLHNAVEADPAPAGSDIDTAGTSTDDGL